MVGRKSQFHSSDSKTPLVSAVLKQRRCDDVLAGPQVCPASATRIETGFAFADETAQRDLLLGRHINAPSPYAGPSIVNRNGMDFGSIGDVENPKLAAHPVHVAPQHPQLE